MKMRGTSLLVIACLTLVAGDLVAETNKPRTPTEFADSMARQGWQETSAGVLQRQVGPDKTETFAYGREGLQWAVTEAQNRLGFYLRQYELHPTTNGAAAIAEQKQEVKRLERILATTTENKAGALESYLNSNCDFATGVFANAYPLTASQGTGAQASAYFSNSTCSGASNCNHVADVFSNTFSQGYIGATWSTNHLRDPITGFKSGTGVTSSALQTYPYTADCYSEASASVTVQSLNLFLSTVSFTTSCPVPPFQVSAINGSTYLYLSNGTCASKTWTATLSGGTAPFTYRWYWNGAQVGTGSSYTRSICGAFHSGSLSYPLSVTVTNGQGGSASRNSTVTVESYTPVPVGCQPSSTTGIEKQAVPITQPCY